MRALTNPRACCRTNQDKPGNQGRRPQIPNIKQGREAQAINHIAQNQKVNYTYFAEPASVHRRPRQPWAGVLSVRFPKPSFASAEVCNVASRPVIPVEAAILHRFGQVLGRNALGVIEVGKSCAPLSKCGRVRGPTSPSGAPPSRACAALYRRGRHFDVDIDAVKQRAADLAQIPLDDGRRAAALALFRFEPNRTKRVSLAHQRTLNADQT